MRLPDSAFHFYIFKYLSMNKYKEVLDGGLMSVTKICVRAELNHKL